MTAIPAWISRFARWVRNLVVFCVFAAAVVVLLLWLAGKFSPKVPDATPSEETRSSVPGDIVRVERVRRPVIESAVGAIRSVQEMTLASKILARVVEANVKAGQTVRAGDVLLRLDDADLQAKFQQAKAAQAAAEATRLQAAADEARMEQLVKGRAVSRQEYERAVTALTSANAEVQRTAEAVKEAQAMLDWTVIHAPFDAIVIDKKVDAGDTVVPGQPLVTLFDPKRMQLIASVRESLAYRLKVGQPIGVRVDVLKKTCQGEVSEIVPESQSGSRSFQVKVTGPCPAGIYTGMYGHIQIPLDEESLLVIPRAAVHQVGQLELVDVVGKGRVDRRSIRTGRVFGENVEVLSGLSEGEEVVVPVGSASSQEGQQ